MIYPPYQILNPKQIFQMASRFPDVFRQRHAQSHKGTYGTLAVVGGAAGMSGAVVLAATAAMYQGCGKVWAGFNQSILPFAVIPERPEIMLATAENLCRHEDISAWVIGCGLGLQQDAQNIVTWALQHTQNQPLLLDADALTLLARSQTDRELAKQHGQLVLTPHPAEAARLLHTASADIQANRIQSAKTISQTFNAFTVLKGHQSLVATPDGRIYTNSSGNAGLATAGSGDVLSGMIGSLLAQGIDTQQAVQAGVWLHGAAADVLRDSQIGETGMLAGEIAPAARWLRNRIADQSYRYGQTAARLKV
ncbi:NAD(P)H-hydrate dehydratase [Neisseria iguanae]|uniref:ADP-dependent (S)-NAD(P)H-hydrate dehydratase n=1 Tax=Neisseria iguanae TaxID=90242 RepID=A0A2P7U373_9NEIS|nr:NAD(P)H-hydrate dehydratase [Neisseria iguanae]PSJ81438.1 NAD(P)H-hydrate dehydratase [Neisseria iguanae]